MSRKMKDSGVEWIGEIPEAWEVTKVKNAITSLLSGSTPDSNNEDYYCDYATGIPWITISDMSNMDYISHTKKTITMEAFESNNLSLLPIGTLIYSIYASLGNVSELSIDATTNQAILGMIIDEKKIYKKYLKFWLKSTQANISYYMNSNTQNNLNANIVKNLPLVFPCIDIQQKIATYLDQKVAEIDNIISKTQASIEEYKRYKQSIITEAVTKGLDPNVPMKDSGIEWIGEIPEHWEVKRVKHSTSVIGSGTTPESGNTDFYDGDIPWIQSGDLYGRDVIIETEKNITPLAVKSYSALRFYKNDFVIVAMYGASVGNVAISKISGYVNQACCVLLPNESNDVRYLYYWLATCKDDLVRQSFGGGQPNISQQKIKNEPYLQAPLLEQQRIADYLDDKCSKIDHIISKKEQLINNLESYKKSLIYEVVTGKKEVM